MAAKLFLNPKSPNGMDLSAEEWSKDGKRIFHLPEGILVSYSPDPPRKPRGEGAALEFADEYEKFFPMGALRDRPWGKDDYWYLGFLPEYQSYMGDCAFHTLALPFAHIPIVYSKKEYALREDVKAQWQELERLVIQTCRALRQKYIEWIPLETRFPVAPSHYGYTVTHLKEEQARKRVHLSRRAFWPWIAFLAMHMVDAALKEGDSSPPAWYMYLTRTAPSLPACWLDQLNNSRLLGDFSSRTPRRGMVIDMSVHWGLFQFVPHYEKAGISLWYFFRRHTFPTFREAKLLFPPKELLSAPPPSTTTSPAIPDLDVAPAESLPAPAETAEASAEKVQYDARSGQKPGETMKQFFARRVKEDAERMQRETDEQRKRREEAIRRVDGSKGKKLEHKAEVFIWEPIDVAPFFIRRRCSNAEKWDEWGEHTDDQKIYHSFTNSWDLSLSFAPTQDVDSCPVPGCRDPYCDHDEDDPLLSQLLPSNSVPSGSSLSAAPATSVLTSSAQVPNSYNILVPRLAELDALTFGLNDIDPIEDVLRFRYGLCLNTYCPADRPTPSMKLAVAQRTLVEKSAQVADEKLSFWLRDFVSTIINKGEVPLCISDVSLSDEDFHFRFGEGLIRRLPVVTEVITGQRFFPVGALHYEQKQWVLAVESRATYREILRRRWGSPVCNEASEDGTWGLTTEQIAQQLLKHGIPFTMLWRANTKYRGVQVPVNVPTITPLWRSPKHSFDLTDYQAYVHMRVSLLQNPAIANAALRAGGILWRLAIESGVNVRRALYGSHDDLVLSPDTLVVGDEYYTRSVLPDGVEDCLCGVYQFFTGYGDQRAEHCWWPKHSTWIASGLNVGYWNRDCELWFQYRVESIKRGNAQPRTSSEWRNGLRFELKKTKKLLRALEGGSGYTQPD